MATQTMKNGKVQYVDDATGEAYDSMAEVLAATEGKEESPILDEIMEGLDVNSPLEMKDSAGRNISVTKAHFIKYYMPKGATEDEQFHCFQAVRATGLSLLVPGECHFFRTGDRPISLFAGYPAYLRQAYANGLEHIGPPEITYDEEGHPEKCTITLKIKGRDDFVWPTWYKEVVCTNKQGVPNARWQKAENQMTIKCSVVNTLRMSGLVPFTFPHIKDEMSDPVVNGMRTLTQEQLEGFPEFAAGTAHAAVGDVAAPGVESEEQEAEAGAVTAADHQIDLSPLRKSYFKTIRKLELFATDDQRHAWQKEISGTESASGWGIEDYAEAMNLISTGAAAEWVKTHFVYPDDWKPEDAPEIPEGVEDGSVDELSEEEQVKEAEAEAAQAAAMAKAEDDGLDITDEGTAVKPGETEPPAESDLVLKINDLLAQSAQGLNLYQEFLTVSLRKFSTISVRDQWMAKNVKNRNGSMMTEDYAKAIALIRELPDVSQRPQNFAGSQDAGETQDAGANAADGSNLAPKLTNATYKAMSDVVKSLGDKYGNLRSKAFRDRVREIIGHNFKSIKTIRESEGRLVLSTLRNEDPDDIMGEAANVPDQDSNLLNEEQFEQVNSLIMQMPERYHESLGSQAFRNLVTSITKQAYENLKSVSKAHGDQLIEAMKEMIREEAAQANGKSAEEAQAALPNVR